MPDVMAELRNAVRSLSQLRPTRVPVHALPGQPFDAVLLSRSPLYRLNRRVYVEGGGRFHSRLVSSPRSLSSAILLKQEIEYSPVEEEMIWSATDRVQKKDSAHLLAIRTYVASLFHEQSHRILWRMLPSAPGNKVALRRYLNFVESLVIVLDMALGDELGERLARWSYLCGSTYDPGTTVRGELRTRRAYRNYLQAALHATYLNLELFDPKDIRRGIQAMFPGLGVYAERAGVRANRLDRSFVVNTNLSWQNQHRAEVLRALSGKGGFVLPPDPMDNRLQYLFAEKWFEKFRL